MKFNTLYILILVGTLFFSCSSDDGGGTPVTPNPEPENAAPQIVSQTYSVFEDISDDEPFAEVTAIDSDGDDLTFEIVSNSDNLFKISEDGNLSLETGASLDYETATEHNITVSVSDG
ncbi:MAG: cadherin repeat domain-containing protein, partial [Bacteroidota bacterium]